MTLTLIAEGLAVELSLPVLNDLVLSWLEHPTFRLQGERPSPLCHRRVDTLVLLLVIHKIPRTSLPCLMIAWNVLEHVYISN